MGLLRISGLCVVLLCGIGNGHAEVYSKLWGASGESWSTTSRLPDFSRGVYHNGEKPIPNVAVVASVKDFGAKGDGASDETESFRKAIAVAGRGAILIPAGRYIILGTLDIRKRGVVLLREGMDRTTLYMPKSLQALLPAESFTALGVPKLKYSFSGAFVEVRGENTGSEIGSILTPASRGDVTLVCENSDRVSEGDWVQLTQMLDAEFGRHLHAGLDAGDDTLSRPRSIRWVVCVTGVEGNRIILDRPLRLDVRPEWRAKLSHYRPTVEEVGIEDMTFEFAGDKKKKHLQEEGFNAIQFRNVANSWVRRVRIVDADLGVNVGGSRFIQAEDLLFVESKRSGTTGHHAIWATGNAQECLFQRFRIDTRYIHDLTVEGFAHGNVFREGTGRAINLDHHRNGPFENLFTNLDVGDVSRLWNSSGRGDRGPHSAARTTVWNIRFSEGEIKAARRPKTMWPELNVIGVVGYPLDDIPEGHWVESPSGGVLPVDLYQAQLKRRLGAKLDR